MKPIVSEGEEKGEIKGKIEYLLMFLSKKFGHAISPEIEKTIKSINKVEIIDEILSRSFEINDLESLKKYLPDKKHPS